MSSPETAFEAQRSDRPRKGLRWSRSTPPGPLSRDSRTTTRPFRHPLPHRSRAPFAPSARRLSLRAPPAALVGLPSRDALARGARDAHPRVLRTPARAPSAAARSARPPPRAATRGAVRAGTTRAVPRATRARFLFSRRRVICGARRRGRRRRRRHRRERRALGELLDLVIQETIEQTVEEAAEEVLPDDDDDSDPSSPPPRPPRRRWIRRPSFAASSRST